MALKGAAAIPACFYLLLTTVAWSQTPAPEDLLRQALALHQSGNVAAAIPLYREYLNAAPANVMARSNLGAALARAGQFQDAIAEYQQALETQPDNAPVRLNLALAYFKAARYSQAADEASRVVAQQPSNRQAVLLAANCRLALGENQKVIDLLAPLERESPDDKAVVYMLGTALIRDQQTAPGQVLLDRILRDGDSAEARMLMGAAKLAARNSAGALLDFKKAADLNPALPDLYSYQGMALAASGDIPGAGAAFHRALESNPNDYNANLQWGILLEADQDYPAARKCFERALEVRPGDLSARYRLAAMDLRDGHTEQARIELQQLTAEDPRFVAAHASLATACYRLKRKEEGDHERALVLRLNAEQQAAETAARAK